MKKNMIISTCTLLLYFISVLHAQTSMEETTIPSLEEILNSSSETTEETTMPPSSSPSSTSSTTTTSTTRLSNKNFPENFSWNYTEFEIEHFCNCDLSRGCDINCCCDTDCSNVEVKSFSGCHEVQPHQYDPRFCFSTEFVIDNNTQFIMEKLILNSEPLFCILNANLDKGFLYLDPKPITNVTHFEDMKSRHEAFLWPLNDPKPSNAKHNQNESHYSIHDPIVIISDNSEFSYLSLPIPTIGSNSKFCQTFSPLQYMEKSEQNCQMIIDKNTDCTTIPEFNAANYMNGLKIIKNMDSTLNKTVEDILNNEDLYVVPKPNVCINLGTNERVVCVEVDQNEALSEPTKNCENILTKLKYQIHHNGHEGIADVHVLIEVTNFSPQLSSSTNDVLVFTQTFGYDHFWSSDKKNGTQLEERSGNPGYLHGKPLRSGVLNSKDPDAELKEDTFITQSEMIIDRGFDELKPFLTIMNPKGDCNNYQRKKIGFGVNEKVGCVMTKTKSELSETCHSIRKNAIDLLVGNQLSRIRRNRDVVNDYGLQLICPREKVKVQRVAMFGNSEITDPQDWIEIQCSNAPDYEQLEKDHQQPEENNNILGECKNVIQSLHIQIHYANVGSLANPQAKIIGINYKFSPKQDLQFQCLGLNCRQVNATQSFEFSTSVNFVDMTQPALEYYKETPVLEAKLPHDFFYPFIKSYSVSSSSKTSNYNNSCCCSLFSILLLVLNHLAFKKYFVQN